MAFLTGWCWFSTALLLVCIAVHVSTFVGIDPIADGPAVMYLHLAIFPPFIAALIYGKRRPDERSGQDTVVASSPRWLRILTGVLGAYAILNFIAMMVLNEGGGPHERDGKYLLMNHGKVLRELSEAEFHQQQAYVVRGFSGHWMIFACASLMVLTGAARLRRRTAEAPAGAAATLATRGILETAPAEVVAEVPPEPTTARAGRRALALYVVCLTLIFSGLPALSLLAALPLTAAAVLALRRRRGFPHASFESAIGCLTVFPNGLLASFMGRAVAEFVYLAAYVGLGAALRHDVAVAFPKEGPAQLSNGDLLHNAVWSGLMLFVHFPIFVAGTLGLTHLAEYVGRFVEVRRPSGKGMS